MSAAKFKVGDRIVCVDAGRPGGLGLEHLRTYTVARLDSDGGIELGELPHNGTYYARRFQLVQERAHIGAADPNPKTLMGAQKPDLSLVPPVAKLYMALAFEDGARKYGAFNWREKAVPMRTYLAAAARHLDNVLDGSTNSADADVDELGHAMASIAIILDARECGMLIDDRPRAGASARVQEELKLWKAARARLAAALADTVPAVPPPADTQAALEISDAQHAITSGPFAEPEDGGPAEAIRKRAGHA